MHQDTEYCREKQTGVQDSVPACAVLTFVHLGGEQNALRTALGGVAAVELHPEGEASSLNEEDTSRTATGGLRESLPEVDVRLHATRALSIPAHAPHAGLGTNEFRRNYKPNADWSGTLDTAFCTRLSLLSRRTGDYKDESDDHAVLPADTVQKCMAGRQWGVLPPTTPTYVARGIAWIKFLEGAREHAKGRGSK
jgi:hypothetical protein